jgi:hypothetical protein
MATQLPAAHEDLTSRRPVWNALSELFLDSSFIATDRERIALTLAKSPYNVSQLDSILLWEVYPACRSNLLWIAGEWLAFEPEWLERRILRGPSRIMYLWAATLGRISLHSSLEWKRLKRLVAAKRGGHARPSLHDPYRPGGQREDD